MGYNIQHACKSFKAIRSAIFTIFTFVFLATHATAQSVEPNYDITATPDWVVKQSYNPSGFKDVKHGDAPYLLYTRQANYTANISKRYTRQVRRIDNIDGAEDASQITIDFDPSYQKLKIHQVTVTRSGNTSNRLTRKSFNLYRVETDADRLIYNGTVTASTVLKDIRVGDVIDYSYSVSGKNAYFKGSIGSYQRLQYGISVDRFYVRLSVPNDRKYRTRLYADAPAPKITKTTNAQIYEWAFDQLRELDVDDDVPNWYLRYPYFQITDKTSWADVGQWKPKFYEAPSKISPELQAAIRKIETEYPWPEGKIDAVLKFVQDEIRYLGIEIGAGGYIPRDPSEVLKRRFGDCKDKTRLMVTMLDRMDIEANALLVHTSERQGIDEYLPSLSAFNHVITHVKLKGKSYFLDPTKGVQLGDIDTFQQSNFGKGVDIGPKSTGIIEVIPVDQSPFTQDTVETFGFGKSAQTVTLYVVTKLYGDQADILLSWKSSDGVDAISKKYLEHYQESYPTIKEMNPIKIEVDAKKSTVTTTEHYMIPEAWQQQDDKKAGFDLEFSAVPTSMGRYIPSLNKKPRTAPLSISYPIKLRHKLKFRLPEGWAADEDDVDIKNDSFSFKKDTSKKKNIYTETYTYTSKKDHIKPDELQKVMRDVERVDDNWGVVFTSGEQYLEDKGGLDSNLTAEKISYIIGIAIGLMYLAFLIFAFVKAIGVDAPWRDQGKFYPVALWKFVLMTTLSFGLYWFYWLYKNWQYIKTVDNESVSPFWRTLFYPIMAASLFGYFCVDDDKGKPWFRIIAIPLAVLIFAGHIVSRISDRWDEAPIWFDLLAISTIYLLIPAVIHVNAINEKRGVAYENNSKLTWHSYVLIVTGLLLIPLAIWGYMDA